MNKTLFQLLLSAAVTIALLIMLSFPFGPVPPMGPFLNPNSGFWANAQTSDPARISVIPDNDFLSDSVGVYFDKYDIPHIFAQNNRDAYYAQGYITARDRLWQMELQTHAAAGRLSEILGSQMIEYDRHQRRIGMGYAAEKALAGIMADEETAEAVEAYSAGINAWIEQLDVSELPLEYKILNYRPEEWTPLKTALLFKRMTYTLASNHSDVRMSNTKAYLGDSFINDILDLYPEWNDPVIPPSREWNFDPLQPKQPKEEFTPSIVDEVMPFRADPANGSNNWAVSGTKTESGYPILSNDPHLDMTLPSIWYAIQLYTPDQNVMGVSLPGSPAVIIGFNEDIAWGTTNVGADVWDWYEIDFRDSTLSEYRYDGEWQPTQKRVETIRVKGEEAVTDTVVYTHHGPVVQTSGEPQRSDVPAYHAMRWIAYEQSNEVKFFLDINRAEDYNDYREALKYFHSPAQNWIFADSTDIAITVAGKYPLKWEEQGRYISNGSDPAYDWQDWIPFEHIPSVKNPDRGFVSSANQDPTDPSYPYYLDGDFRPYERGLRINERLDKMKHITPSDMQKLQLDTFSYHAKNILPLMLQHLNTDTLSAGARVHYQRLADWNYENKGELIAPSIFKYWWDTLYSAIWNDEYAAARVPLNWPSRDQVVQLMHNRPGLQWYDDINTPKTETLKGLINRSFTGAIQKMEANRGPVGDSWKWAYVNNTDIPHVGQIPGLGRRNLLTDGGSESVNAVRGNHGPSWRMVVELGPEIKARGIYPGGQSGNPGSKKYDDMIDDWNNGKLYPLHFMRAEPADEDSVTYSIILK